MRGPTASLALDGVVVAEYLETKTTYQRVGSRDRKHINTVAVSKDDARVIRRWATGKTVTKSAFVKLLNRHGLTLRSFKVWATKNGITPTLRGEL